MQVTFWGTRGTIPVPGTDTVRYGGNTSCVSIQTREQPLFIFDAGTGIRKLGKMLDAQPQPREAVLFLSHSHWDHIQGFPLFGPAYRKDFTLSVLGCPSHPTSLQEILDRQQDSTVFPVPLDALLANIHIGDYCMECAQYGSVRLKSLPLHHPGGSCGFRIEENGRTVVYMTDNELPAAGKDWEKFVGYCRNADLLIHDSQYTEEELQTHRGWGHSSVTQATRLALDANVARLALFHYDPDRTDAEIDQHIAFCNALAAKEKSLLRVFGAAEGMSVEV